MTRHGFTMIELLVVVAIIGILAAALLPTFSHVREVGYASRCESNLKNLAHGVINFANDHDGYMPYATARERYDTWSERYWEQIGWVNWVRRDRAGRDEFTPGRHRHQGRDPWNHERSQRDLFESAQWWGEPARRSIREGSLWPYVRRDFSVYLCPRFRRRENFGDVSNNDMTRDPVRSYVMNSWFSNQRRLQHIEATHNIQPSRLLLFADMQPRRMIDGVQVCAEWCTSGTRRAWDGALDPGNAGQARPTQSIGVVHRGRAQVVFVDGHVESFEFRANNPHPEAATWGELVYKLCHGQL